jgi:tetratricopeptide (TPR) repeat protein
MEATLIGIDVAKSVLHLVAMNSQGQVIWRKALPRRRVLDFLAQLRPATVAMEACATAHYWGREIQQLGHQVRLIHPAFVVPFRKSGKNDFNDAEAICEARLEKAMRLNPQEDFPLLGVGRAYLLMGRYAEAVVALRAFLAHYTNFIGGHIYLAIDYVELARMDDAQKEAAAVRRLSPEFSLQSFRRMVRYKDKAIVDRWSSDLRTAGLK